jgi:hypothetical protein
VPDLKPLTEKSPELRPLDLASLTTPAASAPVSAAPTSAAKTASPESPALPAARTTDLKPLTEKFPESQPIQAAKPADPGRPSGPSSAKLPEGRLRLITTSEEWPGLAVPSSPPPGLLLTAAANAVSGAATPTS